MNELKGMSSFAIQPDPCSAQVQSFLRASAQYLGLTLDSVTMATDCQRLTAGIVRAVPGFGHRYARHQRLESHV